MAEAKADLCTICTEKPPPGQGVVIDCGHFFCKDCIINARGMDRRCSNCRRLSDMAQRDERRGGQAAAQERWARELQEEEDQRLHHGADATQRDVGTAIAVEEEVTARQDHFLDDIATAAAQQRFEARLEALPEPDVPVARGGAAGRPPTSSTWSRHRSRTTTTPAKTRRAAAATRESAPLVVGRQRDVRQQGVHFPRPHPQEAPAQVAHACICLFPPEEMLSLPLHLQQYRRPGPAQIARKTGRAHS